MSVGNPLFCSTGLFYLLYHTDLIPIALADLAGQVSWQSSSREYWLFFHKNSSIISSSSRKTSQIILTGILLNLCIYWLVSYCNFLLKNLLYGFTYFSSVYFSHSVGSDSLSSHELQHTRPPCQITNFWSLLKLMSTESVMPSNHLILCGPHLLQPSIFPSIRVLANESVLRMRWPKYWSFSFGISPSNEYSGMISFRMDWLDLLAVQETLKHLLQHHRSKAAIFQCLAFFIVQLSHPYMTTGKTKAWLDGPLLAK